LFLAVAYSDPDQVLTKDLKLRCCTSPLPRVHAEH
jgi:hypothetical protein